MWMIMKLPALLTLTANNILQAETETLQRFSLVAFINTALTQMDHASC